MPKLNLFSQLSSVQNTSPTKFTKPALPNDPKVTRKKIQNKNRVKGKQYGPSLSSNMFGALKKSKRDTKHMIKVGERALERAKVNKFRITNKRERAKEKPENEHFKKESHSSTSPGAIKLHINLGNLTSTTLVSDNTNLNGASNQPCFAKRKSENPGHDAEINKVKRKESGTSKNGMTFKSVVEKKDEKRSKKSIHGTGKSNIICDESQTRESHSSIIDMDTQLTTMEMLTEELTPTESLSSSIVTEIIKPRSDESITYPCNKQRQIPPDGDRDGVESGPMPKGQQAAQNETIDIEGNASLDYKQGSMYQTETCPGSLGQYSDDSVSSYVFKSSGSSHLTENSSAFQKSDLFEHQGEPKQNSKSCCVPCDEVVGHKSLSNAAIHDNGIKKQRVENAMGLILAKKEKGHTAV